MISSVVTAITAEYVCKLLILYSACSLTMYAFDWLLFIGTKKDAPETHPNALRAVIALFCFLLGSKIQNGINPSGNISTVGNTIIIIIAPFLAHKGRQFFH